jgi:hypothetical protein
MLDIKKAAELLKHHFATVTHEEFLANLEEFCPEFFQARQETIAAAKLQGDEAHRKLEEASKLKIVPSSLSEITNCRVGTNTVRLMTKSR